MNGEKLTRHSDILITRSVGPSMLNVQEARSWQMIDWLDAYAQGNSKLTMCGDNGKPIYYLTRCEESVHFSFQYLAPPGSNLPGLEVDFDIAAVNIPDIFSRYGVEPSEDFIKGFEIISNSGRGDEFGKAITDGLIPIENSHYW